MGGDYSSGGWAAERGVRGPVRRAALGARV